jgi:uncharacterized protein YnzC (UPF0291/DUF896 family)
MKFYAILEDGSQHILRFETLKEFQKYTKKHYIKEIKTLDETDTYSFEDVQGNKVQG